MTDQRSRRRFVQTMGAAGATLLAGCSSGGGSGSPSNQSGTTQAANASQGGNSTDTSGGSGSGPPENEWLRYGSDVGQPNTSPGPAPVASEFSEAWRIENVGSREIVADAQYVYASVDGTITAVSYDGTVQWEQSGESPSGFVRYEDKLGYYGDEVYYVLDAEDGSRVGSVQVEEPFSLDTFTFHEGLLVTGKNELGLGDPWLAVTDVESGEERWRKDVSTPKSGMVVGDVIVASDFDTLAAYDLEDGSVRWEGEYEAMGPFSVADEKAGFGTMSEGALSPTELFAHETDAAERRWRREPPADGVVVDFALDEDTLYVLQQRAVSALDRETGETNWTFNATAEITGNPLLTPSALYLHEEERIEIVDPEAGEQVEVIETADVLGAEDPPHGYEMIPAHGRLYAGFSNALQDDPLLALEAPE